MQERHMFVFEKYLTLCTGPVRLFYGALGGFLLGVGRMPVPWQALLFRLPFMWPYPQGGSRNGCWGINRGSCHADAGSIFFADKIVVQIERIFNEKESFICLYS